ncbi:enoyl-CoA hydratase/isomerase family protein [Streptomyces sp. ISL-12]|uniref:enoyl-CoA-hydratase DpgB n=1 Tax=Streptomyces sp. ISL-12 TaxID=2819177 RepID=UPI001BEB35C9|nr:enoyl-CoA-hydratase DpgB [Streptomyces sp. ISL-12]MBT2415474.1 enoyl-CoA hydratase/isomerase family protein [Streptomyces sp. ISL-12]
MNEHVARDVAEFIDGLGLILTVDGTRPLDELTAAVTSVCARAEEDGGRNVVVLRLRSARPDRSWPGRVRIGEVNRWERAVRRVERLAAVTVAVPEGVCGGPALDLLLTTDFRIASPDFRLLLPVNNEHFWPGMAVHRLVGQLGAAQARRLVLWGHEITADQAVSLGLVNEIGHDLEEALRAAVVMLGRLSGAEVAIRRSLILEASATPYEEAIGSHLAACDRELRRLARDEESATWS